ncbi:MAG: chorismate-binding protein [Desulfonatronovibrio sp.]
MFENPVKVVEVFSRSELIQELYLIDELVKSYHLYAAGFMSYEAGSAFDQTLKVKDDDFPLMWFGLYNSFQEISSIGCGYEGIPEIKWKSELKYDEYLKKLAIIKKHIEQGETYQVNYTFRLRAAFSTDPWLYFNALAGNDDPPFAAFINSHKYSICSFSPELFYKLDKNLLLSRPMKGTISRHPAYCEDMIQGRALRSCLKNRAENVMITDMVRNDMGRIADAGSVKVTGLFGLEKYPTVWQMTSQVRCTTRAGVPSIMKALFPPSSITGAPKSSTMEIISALEVSPRRIYTGSIGYFGPNRQSQFNVAIRTVLVNKEKSQAEYGTGGGIVWDSTPQSEWEECRSKSRSLHRLNPEFSLLETMLWTPEGGYHLLGAHLERLKTAAAYFCFYVDIEGVKCKLEDYSADLPYGCCKIRLLTDKKGRVRIERAELENIIGPIHLSPAQKPINSSDPFVFYKTTHRRVYDDALPVSPEADSVILWNEKGQVTESAAANLVARIDNILCTPPVRCGLLAGTYRQFLLGSGMVCERAIYLEELKSCPEVFLINSVRGFVRTQLI